MGADRPTSQTTHPMAHISLGRSGSFPKMTSGAAQRSDQHGPVSVNWFPQIEMSILRDDSVLLLLPLLVSERASCLRTLLRAILSQRTRAEPKSVITALQRELTRIFIYRGRAIDDCQYKAAGDILGTRRLEITMTNWRLPSMKVLYSCKYVLYLDR